MACPTTEGGHKSDKVQFNSVQFIKMC